MKATIDSSYAPEEYRHWGAAVRGSVRFETIEGAREFASHFPKATKLRAVPVGSLDGGYAVVDFHADLHANGVNGGRNETGVRRYRTFRKYLEALGVEVEWAAPYRNSYATEEAFEEAIAS